MGRHCSDTSEYLALLFRRLATGFESITVVFSPCGIQAKVKLANHLSNVNLIKQFILNNLRHQSMDSFYGSFTAVSCSFCKLVF